MKSIFILVHRIQFDKMSKSGGIDQIISFLKDQEKKITLIEHPLRSFGDSRIVYSHTIKEYAIPFKGIPRWIGEFFFNLIFLFKNHKNIEFVIAVDPLNFLSGFTYSFFARKRIILHLADFSENRFDNKILNLVYLILTRICCSLSKQTICVSKEMINQIKIWGLNLNKFDLIPNSPIFRNISPRSGPISFPVRIIFTKSEISFDEAQFLIELFYYLQDLKVKFNLKLIGLVQQNLRQKFPSEIELTGLIPIEQNFNILRESDIGLAIYLNPNSFEKYADSLKIREYAAIGLPVVSTPYISTAIEGEIAKCVLIASDPKEFANSIFKLVKDPILYDEMSRNARLWGHKNDKERILNEFFALKFKIN